MCFYRLCCDPTPPNLTKRNILWFKPRYSKATRTKIGMFFLQLIKKNSPKEHKFHKIFSRNAMTFLLHAQNQNKNKSTQKRNSTKHTIRKYQTL